MRWVSPSNISPWEGTPAEGSIYSRQQLHVLGIERPKWKTFANLPVKLRGNPADGYPLPEPVIVQCPIIAWTKDRTRVMIITPGGDKKWMDADSDFINGKGPRGASSA